MKNLKLKIALTLASATLTTAHASWHASEFLTSNPISTIISLIGIVNHYEYLRAWPDSLNQALGTTFFTPIVFYPLLAAAMVAPGFYYKHKDHLEMVYGNKKRYEAQMALEQQKEADKKNIQRQKIEISKLILEENKKISERLELSNNSNQAKIALKQKELELKERKIAAKEKELQQEKKDAAFREKKLALANKIVERSAGNKKTECSIGDSSKHSILDSNIEKENLEITVSKENSNTEDLNLSSEKTPLDIKITKSNANEVQNILNDHSDESTDSESKPLVKSQSMNQIENGVQRRFIRALVTDSTTSGAA